MKWDSKNYYMKITICKSAEINIMYFYPEGKKLKITLQYLLPLFN